MRSIRIIAALFAGAWSVQLRPEADKENGTVCISIAVFEAAEWVDLLIANAFKFSEISTKIALHLDEGVEYDEADIKRWQTERIAVTEQRVAVRPFQGSVMWSHLLNAQTMAKRWGNVCTYFVLQASNMMWVRSGMESVIRQRRFSPLGEHDVGGGCAYERRYGQPEWTKFSETMTAIRHVVGHGQPEGSFFPLRHVLVFKTKLDNYIFHELHGQEELIKFAHCYFENTWLQTYMLNFVSLPPTETYEGTGKQPLSLNSMSNQGGKKNDSITFQKLRAVQLGEEGYEGFYAVKRVSRNMTHPITRLIMKLSQL